MELGTVRRRRPEGSRDRPPRRETPPQAPTTAAVVAAAEADCAAEFALLRRAAKGSSLAPGTALCRKVLALGDRQRRGACTSPVVGLDDVVVMCE